MSNILLFSDIHINAHKQMQLRLENCLDALYWVFKTARERSIKDVVFAGDLFQDRSRISVYTYHQTYKIISQFPDLNIWLLLGNHDLWYYEKTDVSSVTPIGALSYVHVIDKPSTLNIAGIDIDFLPFTKNPVAAMSENFETRSSVLVGHIAINGATLNFSHKTKAEVSVEFENDMVAVDKEIFDGYKKVFLGHYHGAQKLNDVVEYIGSTLQLTFNEAFQKKHIIVFDTETYETEYIENTFSPKHLIITPEEIGEYELDGNFVNICVDDLGRTDISELKQKLEEENAEAKISFVNSRNKADEKTIKFDLAGGDLLERYVVTQLEATNSNLDKNILLNIGKEIFLEN